jgi:hypothetical protein
MARKPTAFDIAQELIECDSHLVDSTDSFPSVSVDGKEACFMMYLSDPLNGPLRTYRVTIEELVEDE